MAGRFGSVLTAMVTPFDAEGALDLDAAVALARWLEANGNDGLVIAGTTGEAPTLTDAEQLDLLAAVAEAVTIPVVAGTGSNDTHHAIEMTAKASGLGVAGCLVVTPYYNRPSQAGLEAHFKAVAARDGPPGHRLRHPDPHRPQGLDRSAAAARTRCPEHRRGEGRRGKPIRVGRAPRTGAERASSSTAVTTPSRCRSSSIGASGVIGVATHWSGVEHGEMISAFEKGDVGRGSRDNAAAARVVRVRDERRHSEPHPDEGDDAGARTRGGPMPAPARAGACGHRRAGAAGHRQPAPRLTSRQPRAVADPVRIVFLGGLGEIGRNCACVEVDGRIMLLDCGLMFPEADMPGIDLVLPDFTYLRENARSHRRLRRDPRARGSCRRPLVPAA